VNILIYEYHKSVIQNYVEQYVVDQKKISDDQLNDLNDTLILKMYHTSIIELHYFEIGYINTKRVTYIGRHIHTDTSFI